MCFTRLPNIWSHVIERGFMKELLNEKLKEILTQFPIVCNRKQCLHYMNCVLKHHEASQHCYGCFSIGAENA